MSTAMTQDVGNEEEERRREREEVADVLDTAKGWLSVSAIRSRAHLTIAQTWRALMSLKAEGLVEHVGTVIGNSKFLGTG